jgi:hypothetical protein
MEDAYAVSELEGWFKANEKLFAKAGVVGYNDSGKGSANVRIETEQYLIDIVAWDHAACLDIQILDIKTEESTFSHVGDCEDRSDFLKHLHLFAEWFTNVASRKHT